MWIACSYNPDIAVPSNRTHTALIPAFPYVVFCDENDDDIQQFLLHTTRMVSKKLGGFGNHFYVCEQSYCHIFGVKGSWVMHSYHLLSFDKIDVKKGYERGNVLVVLEAANLGRNEFCWPDFLSWHDSRIQHHRTL